MIHVSVDKGETWNMAQLPPVGHEQFYSILAANDEMVFMHVDEPGGQAMLPIWWFIDLISNIILKEMYGLQSAICHLNVCICLFYIVFGGRSWGQTKDSCCSLRPVQS